jgi:hypothetical protein
MTMYIAATKHDRPNELAGSQQASSQQADNIIHSLRIPYKNQDSHCL